MLEKYLEEIENRIDPEVEEDLLRQWKAFWNNEYEDEIFMPQRKKKSASSLDWPQININDAIEDETFEKMLLKELCSLNMHLSNGSGFNLNIRTNYGSNIMASLFGAEVYMMDREYNTLPGANAVKGGRETIETLVKKGIPDLNGGQGKQVMDCLDFYLKTLSEYSILDKYCNIYHPDLQGPFDICEVVWGSDIYLDMLDYPGLVKDFMQLITDTYCAFIDRWFKEAPPYSEDYTFHYGWFHRGKIRLSLDSCMNISPNMYDEFVKPYDSQLLGKYGGVIHSCGKVDHFVPCLADIPGYYAFNLSQPEMNDMEKIYQHTLDKGLKILSLNKETAEEAVKSGRKVNGNIQAFPL